MFVCVYVMACLIWKGIRQCHTHKSLNYGKTETPTFVNKPTRRKLQAVMEHTCM